MRFLLAGWTLALAGLSMTLATARAGPESQLSKDHRNPKINLDVQASSSITPSPNGDIRIVYEVCNRAKESLVFRWPKPYFESGSYTPLSTRKCAVFSRDVTKVVKDLDAPIEYTLSKQSFRAEAFLPQHATWEKNKRTLTTFLLSRGFGDGPLGPDEAKDLEITVTDNNGKVEHAVTWSAAISTVALGLPGAPPSKEIADEIQRQLTPQANLRPRVIPAAEMLGALNRADGERLPEQFREGVFVTLQTQSGERGRANFSYTLGDTRPGDAPLLVIGEKGRVLWVLQYSTARRN